VVFQYNSLLAHLVPSGTPGGLIPVIVIIETVRNIIRPATLAIRLGANIVAGHLLLTLLGSQFRGLTLTKFPFLILGLTLLVTLEIAVACIQAYVFTLLATLYLGEIRSISFNKTIIL
jgi:F-type H+-transporting ATPase subunit a